MGDRLHPDFAAFRSGLRDCLDDDEALSRVVRVGHSSLTTDTQTIQLWPTEHLRELTAMLFNRRPKTPEQVSSRLRFSSCRDSKYRLEERQWEQGIRAYIQGSGVPFLARWADDGSSTRINLNHPAGRATQLLSMMTGSDLMPASEDWKISVCLKIINHIHPTSNLFIVHVSALREGPFHRHYLIFSRCFSVSSELLLAKRCRRNSRPSRLTYTRATKKGTSNSQTRLWRM
jgi:hypothetical protein